MIERSSLETFLRDFYEKQIPDVVEREAGINLEIPIRRVISIIGPRRAGKTYLLFQSMKKLETSIGKSRLLYVDFESDRMVGAEVKDLRTMLEIFFELYPENKDVKVWLFFDEIQNVSGWEKFARSLLDSENMQLIVSGSSSKLLSKELATSLRGRSLSYSVFPFSFREFLRTRNFKIREELVFSSRENALLLNLLAEYLNFGGYPEVVLFPAEKEKILKEILDVTLYRDVVERHKVKNVKALKLLLKHLVDATSFSVHKFKNFLKSMGLKVSKNTLYNYFEYFSDSLVLLPLRKFSFSYKEFEQSIPKIYFVDNGLISLGSSDYTSNKARLMENIVLF